MKAFVQEYGLMITAIIVAFMFFSLVSFLLGNKGIVFVFNNHQLYTEYDEELGNAIAGSSNSALDAINGVQNTVTDEKRPYFKVTDGDYDTLKLSDYLAELHMSDLNVKGGADKYNIRKISGYSNVLNVFTGNGAIKVYSYDKEKDKVSEVDRNNIELVLIVYEPVMKPTGAGTAKKIFDTEDVYAIDKYGNKIWDSTKNEFVRTTQLRYDETSWHRHTADCSNRDGGCGYEDIENFEINMRVPCKIKAIYRYQEGALKCEYTKIFKNEVIDAYTGLILDGMIEP